MRQSRKQMAFVVSGGEGRSGTAPAPATGSSSQASLTSATCCIKGHYEAAPERWAKTLAS
ncbi:hypothetical protein VEE27_09200 [Escherichia coli]|nr:hypothetical protein VEE27_09200 [Escherichia coli]